MRCREAFAWCPDSIAATAYCRLHAVDPRQLKGFNQTWSPMLTSCPLAPVYSSNTGSRLCSCSLKIVDNAQTRGCIQSDFVTHKGNLLLAMCNAVLALLLSDQLEDLTRFTQLQNTWSMLTGLLTRQSALTSTRALGICYKRQNRCIKT